MSWTSLSAGLVHSGDTVEVLVDAPAWVQPQVSARYQRDLSQAKGLRDETGRGVDGAPADRMEFIPRSCDVGSGRCRTAFLFQAVGGEVVALSVRWTLAKVPLLEEERAAILQYEERGGAGARQVLAATVSTEDLVVLPPALGPSPATVLSGVLNTCKVEPQECEAKFAELAVRAGGMLGAELSEGTIDLLVDNQDWFGAMRVGVAMPICYPLAGEAPLCGEGLGLDYTTRPNADGEDVIVSQSIGHVRPSFVVSYTHALWKGPNRRLHLGATAGLGVAEGQALDEVQVGLRSVYLGLDFGNLNLSAGPVVMAYRRETLPAGYSEGDIVADPAQFATTDTWALSGGIVLHVPVQLYRFGSLNEDSTGLSRLISASTAKR